MHPSPDRSFDPTKITRPSPVLLNYYLLTTALATLCVIPITIIALLPNLFKYRTLRYRFDDEGVSMAWGVMFRHEINLTYRRIQDIHVTRNLFQRWMGLATVAIQTASGSATPGVRSRTTAPGRWTSRPTMRCVCCTRSVMNSSRCERPAGPATAERRDGEAERPGETYLYRGVWAVLVGWFKVPEDPPSLTSFAGDAIESFRPSPGFLRYLKFQFWLGLLAVDIGLIISQRGQVLKCNILLNVHGAGPRTFRRMLHFKT